MASGPITAWQTEEEKVEVVIDAFKLWYWRRLLKVPWTARRSTLNIHWKDSSCSWSSRILVIWWDQTTHWKSPWCWERLRAEGEKVSEDEMAGQYHRCNEHELGQTPGDGEGQGGLACCSSCGCKELNTTEQLNNNKCAVPALTRTRKLRLLYAYSFLLTLLP